jgi:hypothetical protein
MKPVTFFIVFHDNVFRENTSDFTEGELREFFKWVAVNEKVPKDFPTWIPILLKEWTMKKHSPLFQMLNFYQNSVFYHLAWNKEHIDSKYIGFGQYDMKIDAQEFRQVYNVISLVEDKADKVFAPFLYDFDALYSSPISQNGWVSSFLYPYNEFFGTNHTLESVSKLPLALLHTFIMPTWFFLHIMPFVENLTPIILRELNWETRHLAGTLERVFALCISCGILEGKLKLISLTGFQHIEDQHSEDLLRGLSNKKSIN